MIDREYQEFVLISDYPTYKRFRLYTNIILLFIINKLFYYFDKARGTWRQSSNRSRFSLLSEKRHTNDRMGFESLRAKPVAQGHLMVNSSLALLNLCMLYLASWA